MDVPVVHSSQEEAQFYVGNSQGDSLILYMCCVMYIKIGNEKSTGINNTYN